MHGNSSFCIGLSFMFVSVCLFGAGAALPVGVRNDSAWSVAVMGWDSDWSASVCSILHCFFADAD